MIGFDILDNCRGVVGVLGKVTEDGEVGREDICNVDVCTGIGTDRFKFGSGRLVVLMLGESDSVVSIESEDEDRVSSSIVEV